MSDDGDDMPLWLHWPAAIISTIIGLIFAAIIVTSTMAQLDTSEWDSTMGHIVDYDYGCNYSGEETHCGEDIIYTYIVEDVAYENDVINLGWTELEYRTYIEVGLERFDVFSWDSKNDLQHIVDWFNQNSPSDEEDELTLEYFLDACDSDGSDVDDELAQCVLSTANRILGYDDAELQDGGKIVVYHHPYDPQNSVLIPGPDGIDFGDFLILISAIIFPFVFLITARKKGPISQALDQFKGLAKTAKDIQSEKDGFRPNNLQYIPTRNVEGTSRERSYNSVINRLNLHSLQKDEQAIKECIIHKFSLTPIQAESFIQSEHVRLTLQLDSPPMPPIPPLSEGTMQSPSQNEENENNEQKDMMAVFASAMEENLGLDSPDSFEPKPLSSGMSYCDHPGCNVTVSNTDFRCFKCRRTFCYDHKGTSVVCPECS